MESNIYSSILEGMPLPAEIVSDRKNYIHVVQNKHMNDFKLKHRVFEGNSYCDEQGFKSHIYMDKHGLIKFVKVKESPINISGNELLRIYIDITDQKSNMGIYEKYVSIYGKKVAPEKMAKHLNLSGDFYYSLTNKEMICLLHMIKGTECSYLSNKLFMAEPSIKQLKKRIKNKLSNKRDLLEIIREKRAA